MFNRALTDRANHRALPYEDLGVCSAKNTTYGPGQFNKRDDDMRKSPSYLVSTIFAAGLVLAACGGGGGDSTVAPIAPVGGGGGGSGGSGGGTGGGATGNSSPPAASSTVLSDSDDASRFLARATFGGSKTEIASVTGSDAADWISREFSKPVSLTMPALLAQPRSSSGSLPNNSVDRLYWDHMVTSNDQLRQRMAFALSQILVYSDNANDNQITRSQYQDVLIRNAFGNYRDLLEEVTYSPAMGRFLTYLDNRKGDPRTGRMPDENYAREILQLFTIGIVELNMDGTPRLDAQGQQIETYNNDDVIGLARVFTGLRLARDGNGQIRSDSEIVPMQMFDDRHSELEKIFLGTTIPAGTLGDESIRQALDTIFQHPNVAPFLSRQLIQRFTHSSPSPEYVERVSTAFESGSFTSLGGQQFGNGQRGDLQATLAAVLLEPTLYSDPTGSETIAFGKVREPILRFAHWARAFNVSGVNASNEHVLKDTRSSNNSLGQQAFKSPSVFNFYRPGYIAPGTQAGAQNITVPEFQIVNDSSSVGLLNFMTDFAFERTRKVDRNLATYSPNYSEELTMVDDPQRLVDHLDDLLTGGRMSDTEKADIVDIVRNLENRTGNAEQTAEDHDRIVQTAVTLVLNSPSYAVTW